MGDVAAAAGMSRATLHRLFPSRDDLVEAIGLLAVDRIDAAFAAARLDKGTAPEALTRLVEAVLPAVHQFAFLMSEAQIASSPTLLERDQILQLEVERMLRRGQEEGSIRYDLPVAWLAYALTGLLLGAEEASRRGAIAPRDTVRLIVETFMRGAGATRKSPGSPVS